jgi:zinc finger HIT domain-containing protein 1
MGRAYDGKKRWNDTILATTARAPAASGRHTVAKKRLSGMPPLFYSQLPSSSAFKRCTMNKYVPTGRAHRLSAAMRRVDDDTRDEVRNARLDALEADNFGEDAEDGDGGQDGDEAYVDEEEGATSASVSREPIRKKRRVAVSSKKRWKVKSLAQLVFEELGSGENSEGPNYLTAAMGPPTHPARKFCCVCGFFANYNCRRCGSRYCSVGCGDQHKESGCMKFGL